VQRASVRGSDRESDRSRFEASLVTLIAFAQVDALDSELGASLRNSKQQNSSRRVAGDAVLKAGKPVVEHAPAADTKMRGDEPVARIQGREDSSKFGRVAASEFLEECQHPVVIEDVEGMGPFALRRFPAAKRLENIRLVGVPLKPQGPHFALDLARFALDLPQESRARLFSLVRVVVVALREIHERGFRMAQYERIEGLLGSDQVVEVPHPQTRFAQQRHDVPIRVRFGDQALKIRNSQPNGPSHSRIIAVGGGKGGAGKTLLSANLALGLADRGARVIIVDADLGGANVHTVLGVQPPAATLSDFISGALELDDLAVKTPFENLRLISGALDDIDAANPQYQQKMRLLRHLGRFDADFLLLDLGAGSAYNILDFFLIADHRLLVVRPEPTSVENAYRFLKAGFLRRLHNIGRAYGISDLVAEASKTKNTVDLHTPLDVMRAIEQRDKDAFVEISALMDAFAPHLIVNEVRDDEEADDTEVAEDMASGCRRFFGVNLQVLGTVPADPAVRRAVRQRQPLLRSEPESPAAIAIRTLAARLHMLADAAGNPG
jgi:flagellar biosynthesis protein FlhG